LFASPAGRAGKECVRKIVERFGRETFDFLLMVYDGSQYDDPCFSGCTIVHDPSPLFWQLKRHLTPELCRKYEYVFIWMDDLDVLDFNPHNFLQILRTHRIEVVQPAISHDSIISHQIVAHQPNAIGRYTDFVEQMAFAFRGDLWERFWRIIEPARNPWGWGYDELAYARCGFRRMAIIDAEVIRHLRKGSYHEAATTDHEEMLHRCRRFHRSRKTTLCPVSNTPWQKHVIAPLKLFWHRAYVDLYALQPTFLLRRFIRAYLRRSSSTAQAS
jgi:hypothetical protein